MPLPFESAAFLALRDQLEAANQDCRRLREQVVGLKARIDRMQSLVASSRPGGRRCSEPFTQAAQAPRVRSGDSAAHRLGLSMARVRRLVRSYADGQHEGWLGVAPSYLCADLPISCDDACALLLELEARGVVRRNSHGTMRDLPDGRICPTRFDIVREED